MTQDKTYIEIGGEHIDITGLDDKKIVELVKAFAKDKGIEIEFEVETYEIQ